MPKVSRKDTGGATHARERGDAKQARASAATSVAGARADDVLSSLGHVRVQGGAGPLARASSLDSPRKGESVERPSSPDSPLLWSTKHSAFGVEKVALVPESDEVSSHAGFGDDETRRIAAAMVAAVRRVAKHVHRSYINGDKLDLDMLKRVHLMRTRRAVPGPGAQVGDTVRESAREILVNTDYKISSVQRDPAAPMELAVVHPGVRIESWPRSTDLNMVTEAAQVVRTEPSEYGHMLRPDGAPCATMQLGLCCSG